MNVHVICVYVPIVILCTLCIYKIHFPGFGSISKLIPLIFVTMQFPAPQQQRGIGFSD